MKYLWDTDTCEYFLNGHNKINQRLQSVGGENICTSIINIAELKFGAYILNRLTNCDFRHGSEERIFHPLTPASG